MKNTLIFDLQNDCFKSIEYEQDGTNTIFIKFINVRNVGNDPCLEFHKTEKHTGVIKVNIQNEAFVVEIPTEYMDDDSILHFRYIDTIRMSSFFHLLGDVTKYVDVQVMELTPSVFEIDRNGEKKPEPEPPEPEPPTPESTTTINCLGRLAAPENMLTVLDLKIQEYVKEA